jgi:hypothetical protein
MVYFNRYTGTQNNGTTSYSIASVSSNFISVGVNPNYVVNDQIINFVSVGGLTGVSTNTNYKVVNKQADGTFKINDMNGNAVSVTSSGTITASIQSSIFSELKEQFYFINAKGAPNYYFTLHNTYEDAVNNANPITNISPQPRFSDYPYYTSNYSSYGQMYGCFIIPRVYYLSNSGTNLNQLHPLLFMANMYTHISELRFYRPPSTLSSSYSTNFQNSLTATSMISSKTFTHISPIMPIGYGLNKKDTLSRLVYLTQRGFNIIIGRNRLLYSYYSYWNTGTMTKTGLFLTGDQTKSTVTPIIIRHHYDRTNHPYTVFTAELVGQDMVNRGLLPPYMPLGASKYCF